MMKLYTTYRSYIYILFFILATTLVAWLPYLLHLHSWFGLTIPQSDFHYVYRHYDGPLYIVAAKTWYVPDAIEKIKSIIDIPPVRYFAAHLPLYPATIVFFATVLGYLKGMIFSTLFFTVLLGWFFYYFVEKLKLSKNPLLLTFVFLMLPRFLVVRSVGAPESMFLLLILASLYSFEKQKFLWAGIFGGLSVMTKTPGILLFAGYVLVLTSQYMRIRKISWSWLGLFLTPAGFLVVSLIYQQQYGDFFAYFKSGDNIHLIAPFSAFNANKVWVGTAWLEDILFYLFIYALAIFHLKDIKYNSLFYFAVIFFIAVLFVEHRDIARYSLPLWPLACIAFERFLTSKKALLAGIIVLPGIYMYAWNFMSQNVMPISNWAPFM